MPKFVQESILPVTAEQAFAWHERPGAFERLQPPWEDVKIVAKEGGIRDGDRVTIEVAIGPIRQRWLAEHSAYVAGRQFRDTQLTGPFARFQHTHRFDPVGDTQCRLTDEIEYQLPLGVVGQAVGGSMVAGKLARAFRYRHQVTVQDLQAHARASQQEQTMKKILVTGASGLVGRDLVAFLSTGGHDVLRLSRSTPREPNEMSWDPSSNALPAARLEGVEGVVHLAGENIAGARWNASVKDRIRSSRVDGTRLLCETLAKLQQRPKALVCASAIGFYGDRAAEELQETSAVGKGYLPEVCQAWEDACQPARDAGIRVVNLRIGVILTPKGGALQKMLFPFKMGGGGIVGSGEQYWSWISLDDVIGAIHHCLMHNELQGAVNATAPQPATNYEFTKALGAVLNRPTILPMPAFAARLALGEMADSLLLASARVLPTRLLETGYSFRTPSLDEALEHVLGA